MIRVPDHYWKYYYFVDFNSGTIYNATVRRDYAPEVFTYLSDYGFWVEGSTYDNNKNGFLWRTYNELQLKSRSGGKMRRVFNEIYEF